MATKTTNWPPMPDGMTLNDVLAVIAPGARKLGLPPRVALGVSIAMLRRGILPVIDDKQFRRLNKFAKEIGQHVDDIVYKALDGFLTAMEVCHEVIDAEASREADLLFGHCDCTDEESCQVCRPPEDESEIIFASGLSLEEKLAKLQVIRTWKAKTTLHAQIN